MDEGSWGKLKWAEEYNIRGDGRVDRGMCKSGRSDAGMVERESRIAE